MEKKNRQNFIKEVIRLEPPLNVLSFELNKDRDCEIISIDDNNYNIDHDTSIILLTKKYNYNPDIFDNPDIFNPNRDFKNKDLTFGSGPRICPGKNIAITEIDMFLEKLVSKYSLKLVGNVVSKTGLTVQPSDVLLLFENRKNIIKHILINNMGEEEKKITYFG